MERVRRALGRDTPEQSYEPLEGGSERPDGERIDDSENLRFSWTTYAVFLLLGVAMLWSWNMFLAAAPYFQRRFKTNDNLLRNFQSAILSVSTVGNLGSMIVLTKMQANANYPKRITASLGLYAVLFTLLALSTKLFLYVSAGVYFAFLMVMVLGASLATGMCQNGVFAYVSGFGQEEYTQAIMTGQGIAGVLPAVTQIISVLSVTKTQHIDGKPPQASSTSAFVYFLTATGVSAITLLAFIYLLSTPGPKQRAQQTIHHDPDDLSASTQSLRKPVPLRRLLRKLFWLASAVAITFAITMFFPVFTSQIISVRDPITSPRLFQPATFIPLGFFFWNLGDLIGRMGVALPALRLTHRPHLLFILSIARLLFVPLYFLCNINGNGATIQSDFFYLFIVQLFFGMTNGYLGSNCMMGFGEYVESEEREAAGGFMSLCLVGGLTVGSFLSFAVASQI